MRPLRVRRVRRMSAPLLFAVPPGTHRVPISAGIRGSRHARTKTAKSGQPGISAGTFQNPIKPAKTRTEARGNRTKNDKKIQNGIGRYRTVQGQMNVTHCECSTCAVWHANAATKIKAPPTGERAFHRRKCVDHQSYSFVLRVIRVIHGWLFWNWTRSPWQFIGTRLSIMWPPTMIAPL